MYNGRARKSCCNESTCVSNKNWQMLAYPSQEHWKERNPLIHLDLLKVRFLNSELRSLSRYRTDINESTQYASWEKLGASAYKTFWQIWYPMLKRAPLERQMSFDDWLIIDKSRRPSHNLLTLNVTEHNHGVDSQLNVSSPAIWNCPPIVAWKCHRNGPFPFI